MVIVCVSIGGNNYMTDGNGAVKKQISKFDTLLKEQLKGDIYGDENIPIDTSKILKFLGFHEMDAVIDINRINITSSEDMFLVKLEQGILKKETNIYDDPIVNYILREDSNGFKVISRLTSIYEEDVSVFSLNPITSFTYYSSPVGYSYYFLFVNDKEFRTKNIDEMYMIESLTLINNEYFFVTPDSLMFKAEKVIW